MNNKKAKYYSEVGSYRGALKVKGRWVSASDLNRICKVGMIRWQGPPSNAITRAMYEKPTKADILLPHTWDKEE